MSWRRNEREKKRRKKRQRVERVKAAPRKTTKREPKVEHPLDCLCYDCLWPIEQIEPEVHLRPKPWRPPT